jgi:hypothetical protein
MPLQQSSLLYEIKKGKDKDSRNFELETMRPKARGLAKYGGPPGWLEESDTSSVICT